MRLDGVVVQPEKQGIFNLKSNLLAIDPIKLYLSLRFNEHREQLLNGHIQFGLKGGQLTLRLENGTIAVASPGHNRLFELSGLPATGNQEMGGEPSCVTMTFYEKKTLAQGKLSQPKVIRAVEACQHPNSQVSDRTLGNNPTWVLAGYKNKVLKGFLKHTLLGTVNVLAKPCRVEARFCVSPQDIYIMNMEGLLPPTVGKKKKAVIERAIARRLLKQKFKPYLSRQELQYE
jgi:hypothetical protein